MILLIDNYDSFSYNLYQLIGEIEKDIRVIRNDELSINEIFALDPTHIIISPGPGRPANAGVCEELVRIDASLEKPVPILGVCLGHQAICEAFGAEITYAKQLMHGKQSVAELDVTSALFKGMDRNCSVARYHSLAAAEGTLPECLKVIARTEDNEIMAVQHVKAPIFGVQFHPESILTKGGSKLMKNFLAINRNGENKKMIREAITKLMSGTDLAYDEAAQVTREIMTGETTPAQTASFLTALHLKGETTDEVTACGYVMRDCATRVTYDGDLLEIVGTGGDGAQSINISTMAALVCAAAGCKVTKHGNRAASSKCGTADCLEALGVNIAVSPEGCVKLLDEVGMCFLFAQKYHSAMKYVGPVRRDIGIPTVFNILGPLTNPAHANIQLLGVYKEELCETMAQVLMNLGVKRGMAVYGQDKLDEISVSAPTTVVEFENGSMRKYEITPEQFGFKRHTIDDIRGGDPEVNAMLAREILGGAKNAGRDAVLINAGAALHLYQGVSMEEGIKLAAEIIDSGAALATLEKYIAVSNEVE